jgi:hypothetical protein
LLYQPYMRVGALAGPQVLFGITGSIRLTGSTGFDGMNGMAIA